MRVLITGSTGFLGSHVVRALQTRGDIVLQNLYPRRDLREPEQVAALCSLSPDAVIHLAYPSFGGGIGAVVAHPHSMMTDLLRMDLNVIETCAWFKVPKLVCVGSVCAYPAQTQDPADEPQYLQGPPEATNAPYGLAKRTQLAVLQAARAEHGLVGIHLILDNLYGPGDRSHHVIPETLRKMDHADRLGAAQIDVWGDGSAVREFLYIEDAVQGILAALDQYDSPEPLNLVSGTPVAMRDLVEMLATLRDYRGAIAWDPTQPTGQRRRWFDPTRAAAYLGWRAETPWGVGLHRTVAWWQADRAGRADLARAGQGWPTGVVR